MSVDRLLPLADTNCAACGAPLDVQPGQSFVGSTDGKVWHYGCAPSTPASPPEQPTDVERVARAIACDRWDRACSALGTPNYPRGDEWTACLPDARAAIAALPTPQTDIAMWRPIESAPHACHVLAACFDDSFGEWSIDVVASPPTKPFTHWMPLPAPPTIKEPRP